MKKILFSQIVATLLFATSVMAYEKDVGGAMEDIMAASPSTSSVTAAYDGGQILTGYLVDESGEHAYVSSPNGYFTGIGLSSGGVPTMGDRYVYGPFFTNSECTGTKYILNYTHRAGDGAWPGNVYHNSILGETLYTPFDSVPKNVTGYYAGTPGNCNYVAGTIALVPTFPNDPVVTGFQDSYDMSKFVVIKNPHPTDVLNHVEICLNQNKPQSPSNCPYQSTH